MMPVYLWLDILILAIPLALTFEKRVRYIRHYPALLSSIAIVGSVYVIWDIVATARGDWAFNEKYLLGPRVWGLPIEEILFFIVVPYSCIFIYEALGYLRPRQGFKFPPMVIWLGIFACVVLGLLNSERDYTKTVFLFCAGYLLAAMFLNPRIFSSWNYWGYLGLSFAAFLISNYFLTALPVVVYNEQAIWGARFLTIPCEDFLYAFSMLSFYLLAYLLFKERFRRRV